MSIIFGVIFGIVAVVGRLVPHVPNFAPVGALALWASMYLPRRYSIPGLLALVFVSDLFLGFYDIKIMAVVYASYLAIVVMGRFLKQQSIPLAPFLGTLASAILFYLTTNFAVWAFGTYYAHTWNGLVECYLFALPFFRTTLQSDIVYGVVFFGIYEMATVLMARRVAKTALAKA